MDWDDEERPVERVLIRISDRLLSRKIFENDQKPSKHASRNCTAVLSIHAEFSQIQAKEDTDRTDGGTDQRRIRRWKEGHRKDLECDALTRSPLAFGCFYPNPVVAGI